MTALVLTLREAPARRIDVSPLAPDRLQRMSRREIAGIPLHYGNRRCPLGDLFEIDGTDPGTLVIRNATDRLDGIGARMRDGSIRVEGDAGNYLGHGMLGGSIRVEGRSGHWTASGMAAGCIGVDGDCGDFAGAAQPGDRKGMLGGSLLIRGRAGDRLGDHMRRGQILVGGGAGDYCGSRMLAGTIAVLGDVGAAAGYGMRRGTLLFTQRPAALPATFGDCGIHELAYLRLLFASWHALDNGFAGFADAGIRVRRFVGDLATRGNGELLAPPD